MCIHIHIKHICMSLLLFLPILHAHISENLQGWCVFCKPFINLQKEPYILRWKKPYILCKTKLTCSLKIWSLRVSKDTQQRRIFTKEPYVLWKELYIRSSNLFFGKKFTPWVSKDTQELWNLWKEPCILSKELYIRWSNLFLGKKISLVFWKKNISLWVSEDT